MKTIKLQFSSAIYLIAFRKFSKAIDWDIDLNELTVRCTCPEKDIQAACRDFKATIITNVQQPEPTVLLRELDMSKVTTDQLRSA